MKKNLKNLFSEDVQNIISEDTLTAIEEAIETKTQLAVDAALRTQDEDYAGKLKDLMEKIDSDHTSKMKRIIEAYDKDKSAKLVKIVKKYEREQNSDLKKFKKSIVESVGMFIDEFINETVSKEDLEQAVKNKTAFHTLNKLRGVFAIDEAIVNESISSAIKDGKQTIETLRKENEELKKKTKILESSEEDIRKKFLLENKTSKFSDSKRKFFMQALEGKSLKFIEENFDYVARLFDNQEKKQLHTLKEDALKDRKIKPDFVKNEKVITEKVNTDDASDPYVTELEKFWSK
jgi:hypothetical protein